MSTEDLQSRLEMVEKRLHYMRIAIIVLVGFFVYDILSADGLGAPQQITRGTVKAQEFVLLDDSQATIGSWKAQDEGSEPMMSMYSTEGYQSSLSAQSLAYFAGNKIDSLKQMELDKNGIRIHDENGALRMRLGNTASDSSESGTPLVIYSPEGAEVFQAPLRVVP